MNYSCNAHRHDIRHLTHSSLFYNDYSKHQLYSRRHGFHHRRPSLDSHLVYSCYHSAHQLFQAKACKHHPFRHTANALVKGSMGNEIHCAAGDFSNHSGRYGGREHGHRGGHRSDRHGTGGFRRISADELQLIVLALLAQQPYHGYQLIKKLEFFSSGFYSPSPGMIYPVLTFLEESDLTTVSMEGMKKLYTITKAGHAMLEENRERVNTLLDWIEQTGKHLKHMHDSYAEDMADSAMDNPLRELLHKLKLTVRSRRFADTKEKDRVIAILKQAIQDIENN